MEGVWVGVGGDDAIAAGLAAVFVAVVVVDGLLPQALKGSKLRLLMSKMRNWRDGIMGFRVNIKVDQRARTIHER